MVRSVIRASALAGSMLCVAGSTSQKTRREAGPFQGVGGGDKGEVKVLLPHP